MLKPQDVAPGGSQHETYISGVLKREFVQLDYRTREGKLYSAIAPSLTLAVAKIRQQLRADGDPDRWEPIAGHK